MLVACCWLFWLHFENHFDRQVRIEVVLVLLVAGACCWSPLLLLLMLLSLSLVLPAIRAESAKLFWNLVKCHQSVCDLKLINRPEMRVRKAPSRSAANLRYLLQFVGLEIENHTKTVPNQLTTGSAKRTS